MHAEISGPQMASSIYSAMHMPTPIARNSPAVSPAHRCTAPAMAAEAACRDNTSPRPTRSPPCAKCISLRMARRCGWIVSSSLSTTRSTAFTPMVLMAHPDATHQARMQWLGFMRQLLLISSVQNLVEPYRARVCGSEFQLVGRAEASHVHRWAIYVRIARLTGKLTRLESDRRQGANP